MDKEKLKKLERLFDNGLPTSILNQILLLNNPEINSKIDILLEDTNLDKFSSIDVKEYIDLINRIPNISKNDILAVKNFLRFKHESLEFIPSNYIEGSFDQFLGCAATYGNEIALKFYNSALYCTQLDKVEFLSFLISEYESTNRDFSFLNQVSSKKVLEQYESLPIELFMEFENNKIIIDDLAFFKHSKFLCNKFVEENSGLSAAEISNKFVLFADDLCKKFSGDNIDKVASLLKNEIYNLSDLVYGDIPTSLLLNLDSVVREGDLTNYSLENAYDFFNAHNDFLLKYPKITQACIYTFETPGLNAFISKLDKCVEKLAPCDAECIISVASAICQFERLEQPFPKMNLSILFDLKYSSQQRRELIKDAGTFIDNERISNYLDETYSLPQIKFLFNELHSGNDIAKACNPSYSIEHMRHICFYETKGISFKNEDDYDKNYVKDKNDDYKTFARIMRSLDLVAYNGETRDDLIHTVVKLSTIAEKFNIDIDLDCVRKTFETQHYIEPADFLEAVVYAASEKVDLQQLLTGEFSPHEIKRMVPEMKAGKTVSQILEGQAKRDAMRDDDEER